MTKRESFLMYLLLGLVLVLMTGCGDAEFEAVGETEPQTCSIQGNKIVCPDGTMTDLPSDGQDGTDGKDGQNAVILSVVKVAANKCVQVAPGVYVENIRSGNFFDVYSNDECKDSLGEFCDNVEPSQGSTGEFGDNRQGGAEVCWTSNNVQVSGSVDNNGDLLIRVLEFLL